MQINACFLNKSVDTILCVFKPLWLFLIIFKNKVFAKNYTTYIHT